MSAPTQPGVVVEPPAAALLSLLGAARPRAAEPLAAPELRQLTRRELGLPEEFPIVGSGHQAAFWHPGIVVKSILAQELAGSVGGSAFHVVVEQDTDPVAAIEVPLRDPRGELRATVLDLERGEKDIVAGRRPAFDPVPPPRTLRPALPCVDEGLARIAAALRMRRGEGSAALQVTRAAFDLLVDACAAPALLSPAALLRTTAGRELLGRMADDPRRCAESYNAALAASPHAASALLVREDRVELPLWRLGPRGERLRAYDDDLDRFAEGSVELLPRALLMTGFLRLVACDLFVHGTGGAAYDRLTERWFDRWLGVPLAPLAVATATVRLPFGTEPALPVELASSIARLRRAISDPESVAESDDAPPGPAKRRLLAAIEAAPRRSAERRARYADLHRALEDLRRGHATDIERRRAALADAERRAREAPILLNRRWPFPLYPRSVLTELRDEIVTRLR